MKLLYTRKMDWETVRKQGCIVYLAGKERKAISVLTIQIVERNRVQFTADT
ncbi:MAG: hypothetical protein V8Q43_01245 [Christensenellaceae bacterium]